MHIPEELYPLSSPRVMDLVAAATIDISDWANFKGGAKKAASNPKYCYEWTFEEPGKLVVLNLWYKHLNEVAGTVFQSLNYRKHAASLPKVAARGMWAKRSLAMDSAFATAYARSLPVRVIICDGEMGDVIKDPNISSKVSRRVLDPIPWAVTEYDPTTGECKVTRGAQPSTVFDQFSVESAADVAPMRKTVTGQITVRDAMVRTRVLARARGYCEFCSQPGFTMTSGAAYLETHHIVPLSEKGIDNDTNVIALCPNDHRRAHYGLEATSLRERFVKIVRAKLKIAKKNADL